jgi:hypothetical protein
MNNILITYLKISSIIANLIAICSMWFLILWSKDQFDKTKQSKFFWLIIIIVLIFIGNIIYRLYGGK